MIELKLYSSLSRASRKYYTLRIFYTPWPWAGYSRVWVKKVQALTMNLMNVISPITFANESLSTHSRVTIIITLEFFRWALRRGWFLPTLSKNWCQDEIRNWRKWTLLFRSFQRSNSMRVSNVSFQQFFRFEGWITLSALKFLGDDVGVPSHLGSHQGGSRRLSFLLQKGFPSPWFIYFVFIAELSPVYCCLTDKYSDLKRTLSFKHH